MVMFPSAILGAVMLLTWGGLDESSLTTSKANAPCIHAASATLVALVQTGSARSERDELWDAEDDSDTEPVLGLVQNVLGFDGGSLRFRAVWPAHRGAFRPDGRSLVLRC